ncbi:MAG: Hpt domain-containing protein [Cyanobacteria bacterium SBC]|nr:Hpt domain-containing protein [Cyanobacteria bacterium SBC]
MSNAEFDFSAQPSQNTDLDPEVFFDTAALEELTLGDTEFQQEMLETFMEDMPVCIAKLKQALQDEDWTHLAHHAHQVKGASRTACVRSIPEIAVAIEDFVRERQKPETQASIEKLEGAVNRLREFIREWN